MRRAEENRRGIKRRRLSSMVASPTIGIGDVSKRHEKLRPRFSGRASIDASRKLDILPPMSASASLDTSRAAALFHALADDIRVRVVTLLCGGERCVCELMDDLGLAQSRLSWHLKTLSGAGVISGRREGRWIYYSLNHDALAEARGLLDGMKPNKRMLPTRSDCCD